MSCAKQLRRLKGRTQANVALDTRYSSRHKHANEITTVVRDVDTSAFPSHLVQCPCPSLSPCALVSPLPLCALFLCVYLFIYLLGGQQSDGGIVARVHLLKDTGSSGKQHPLRTYKGTSSTAEGDGTEQVLQLIVVFSIVFICFYIPLFELTNCSCKHRSKALCCPL